MSAFNKNGWVSLAQICEERQLVIDAETGKKVLRPAYFSSMNAMIEGAFQFARFFEEIHQKGKVYCSISPDVFYFNLKNGAFHFEGEEFLGEAYVQEPDAAEIEFTEFLAPELAEALAEEQEKLLSETEEQETLETFKECYSLETDRYFMAVYLFEYFFHTGSPFEGKKMVNRCFLSPEEKELFRAREGRFCMEPGEEENIPVKGIQDKLIQYWNEYPEILQKMFQKAFLDGGRLRELRPTEVDWKQLLVRMAMDYKSCHCGFHGFSYRLLPKENGTFACPKCGKIYYPLTNGMDRILLAEGEKLYECQTGRNPMDKDTVTGLIVENRQKKGLYGIKNVSQLLWEKAKDFLQRAFTVIFVATVVIWFLQTFDVRFNIVTQSKDSILALIAGYIAPLFKPLGFGDWRISTALISGFMAKESVVSTLSILYGSTQVLLASLTLPAVISLLIFCLLYTPCVAAIAAIKRELGGKWALIVVFGQCAIAWLASFVVYHMILFIL